VLVHPDDDYAGALDSVSVDTVAEALVNLGHELSVIRDVGHNKMNAYLISEIIYEKRVFRETVGPVHRSGV